MTIAITPLNERDFFSWYELFTAYASSAGVEPDDEQTMRIWTVLQGDDAHALIAKDAGEVVGFAHFTSFVRLLQGDSGYTIEDLYVTQRSRGRGVATALIESVRARAEQDRRVVVRWAAQSDEPAAKALRQKFAAATASWAMQDLTVG